MILETYVICDNPKVKNNQKVGFKTEKELQEILLRITVDLSNLESYKETVISYNDVLVKGTFVINQVGSYNLVIDYNTFLSLYLNNLEEEKPTILQWLEEPIPFE